MFFLQQSNYFLFVSEHVYGPPASTPKQRALGWVFGLTLFGVVIAICGFFFYQKKQKDSAKRFY